MISVIIPVYNEEKNLNVLNSELNKVLKSLVQDYEIIYIDDGSRDNSLKALINIANSSEKIRLVQLSQHYGQTPAMQAGIDYSRGEIIVFLDADLQNNPSDIPKLLNKMEEGFDVVSGWRRKREDPLFTKKIPSYIANYLISKLSKIKLHDFGCTFKVYKKDIIKKMRLYGEMHRLLPIYAARQGASIAEVEVSHRKRFRGNSKYGLGRIFKVVLDFFTAEFINNYISNPIYVFGFPGIVSNILGVLLGVLIVIRKIYFGGVWVSPLLFIMVVFIIIGFQFILMGLLAEISVRAYYETTGKPTYSVKKIMENRAKIE